jgi:hypothetical protein
MRYYLFILCFFTFAVTANKYSWQWLKVDSFNQTYTKTIGTLKVEPWVKSLGGPSSPSKLINIEQEDWVHINSCKPHDCAGKNITILFNSKTNEMCALLHSEDVQYIGNPNQKMRVILKKLHKKEFGTK